MKVLVIGGTSFIGPYVVRQLSDAGHDVTVFHRGQHEPDLPKSVKHVHNPSAAIPILDFPPELVSLEPDVVLHMVAMGEPDSEAAVRAFRRVAKRLVVLSSGDVYAAYGALIGSEDEAGEPGLLNEDCKLRDNLYPYRKLAKNPDDWTCNYEKILVEKVVMSATDLPATILRLPAVYGPGESRHGFFPYLKRMDDGRKAILLDERLARWHWTHGFVENVAAAITAAVLDDRSIGRIYNVGEEITATTEERVRSLAHLTGWSGEIVKLPRNFLPSHLRDTYNYTHDLAYDTSRIRRELGYNEEIMVEEGLRRTIASLHSNSPAFSADHFDYAAEDAALRAADST